MKKARKLRLETETVRALRTRNLDAVAGGDTGTVKKEPLPNPW